MLDATPVETNLDRELDKTKGNLFFQKGSGFLGALLGKLEFRWTTEIPTAAISADTLYWNPDFFRSLDKETRITVLAHELWHNGYLHGALQGDRCPDIWNIAGDHVINLMLKEHGYYMGGFPYVMDDKYIGWSTQDIYDDLIKGGMQPFEQDGNVPGGIGKDVLPVPQQQVSEAVGNVVAAAATARISGAAGDIPGEVVLTIDKFLNPKLPWETLLFNFFNALTSEEYSYSRPNRRYSDPIMPGLTGRNGLEHLTWFVDTSGSISDQDILRFNSEVKHIWDDLRPEKLTLFTFDTKIRDEYVFDHGDEFNKISVTGRGGTDLTEVMAKIRSEAPSAAVIFTDLYVSIPPQNPGVPIIWICVDNPNAEVPYGTLVHFSE